MVSEERIALFLDAAQDNNRSNGALWSDWESAEHLHDTYAEPAGVIPALNSGEIARLQEELEWRQKAEEVTPKILEESGYFDDTHRPSGFFDALSAALIAARITMDKIDAHFQREDFWIPGFKDFVDGVQKISEGKSCEKE